MIPSDLTSRVGEEVTFGDIVRRAWQVQKQHGMTIILYLVVVGLAGLVASCLVGCVVVLGPLAFTALVAVPAMAGLSWSVVLTFDGRRPQFNDIFLGFRTRFNSLAVIGLIQAGLQLIPIVVSFGVLGMAAFGSMSPRGGGGGGAFAGFGVFEATRIMLEAGNQIYGVLVGLIFFIAPLLVFTVPDPKPVECIKTNWRVLRSRPGQFLATYFAPVALSVLALLLISPLIIGGAIALVGENLGLGLPLMILGVIILIPMLLWISMFALFLKAAFFRAVCGYTLAEPEPNPMGPFGTAPMASPPGAPTAPISPMGQPGQPAQPDHTWPLAQEPIPYDMTHDDASTPMPAPPEADNPYPSDDPYRTDDPWRDADPPKGGPS
jgi:hypothetical protein